MSVRRKLFIAMASFIVGMGLVFALVTQIILRDALNVMVEAAKKTEIEAVTARLIGYYTDHGGVWEGIEQSGISDAIREWHDNEASIVVLSPDRKHKYASDSDNIALTMRFGISSILQLDGETIGFLYYHDQAADFLSKLRIGIMDSTRVLLMAGTIIFVLVSLLVVYWLSKRLTLPLRLLLPVIDRLGKGELGVQAPVVSKDEYGKVAIAFNEMSGKLQQAEQVRRNLTADVAHELRTPLTIIRGKLDLVQQSGQLVAPESLLPLQDDLIRLTRIVDDLHQLSLAEARKLPLELKQTDLTALLLRIAEHLEPEAKQKGIDISVDCLSGHPVANVDPNRISQVFLNLLVNAVRYTPEGGTVKIVLEEATHADADGEHVLITIADSGPGIDPEHLPFLFNRFYRTDEARARNSGGMGLGLAIAKEFITAHNGTIEAKSRLGYGTSFLVRLPID